MAPSLIGVAIELVWAGYYDVALRDTVMAISAFCLARLTAALPRACKHGTP